MAGFVIDERMKAIRLLLVAALCCMAYGQDPPKEFAKLETLNGKIYLNAKVRKIDPDGISIMHDEGGAKVPFEMLPLELRTHFGFDPEKAEEHRKAVIARENAEAKNKAVAVAERRVQQANQDVAEAIEKTGVPMWLKVQQNPGGAYSLCRWGRVSKAPIIDRSGLSPKVTGYRPSYGIEEESWIAVYGLGNLADGERWAGILYPCGVLNYESVGAGSRTVRRYATSIDIADRLLSSD